MIEEIDMTPLKKLIKECEENEAGVYRYEDADVQKLVKIIKLLIPTLEQIRYKAAAQYPSLCENISMTALAKIVEIAKGESK